MTPMRMIKETTKTTVETISRIPFEYVIDYVRRALSSLKDVQIGHFITRGLVECVITTKIDPNTTDASREAICSALNIAPSSCSRAHEVDGTGNDVGKVFMTVKIRTIDIIRGALNTQDVVTDRVNDNSIWIKTQTVKITYSG